MRLTLGLLAAVLAFVGCARTQKPVLYPNSHLRTVGQSQAARDIEECRQLASEYVQSTAGKDAATGAAVGGAVGAAGGAAAGAVRGRAGTGAAAGAAGGAAAGAVHGLLRGGKPSPVYKEYVNRCLRERGYDVLDWQ